MEKLQLNDAALKVTVVLLTLELLEFEYIQPKTICQGMETSRLDKPSLGGLEKQCGTSLKQSPSLAIQLYVEVIR